MMTDSFAMYTQKADAMSQIIHDTKARYMHRLRKNHQDGSTLVVTILVLVILSILGTAALTMTNTELLIARNMRLNAKAFYLAEAGVEHVYAQWSDKNSTLSSGFYNATIKPYNGANLVNSTNIESFVIESNGTINNANEKIMLIVEKKKIPINVDGALGIYAVPAKAELVTTEITDAAYEINGYDNLYPDEFDCSNCNPKSFDCSTDVSGIYFSDSNSTVDFKKDNIESGNDVEDDDDNDDGIKKGNGKYDYDYWIDIAQDLKKMTPDENKYEGEITQSIDLGTRENPKLSYVSSGTNIKTTGNLNGAGILVIDGSAQLSITGRFHFEGLVLILPQSEEEVSFFSAGTPNVYGSIIVAAEDYVDVGIAGDSSILYSKKALENANNINRLRSRTSWKYIIE